MRRTATGAALVGLLTVSLALTACGESEPEPDGADSQNEETAAAPDDQFNETDIDYLSGMIVHHEQAVEMSEILLEDDSVDPEVAALAEDIRAAQQPEIDHMESSLNAWGHHPPHDEDHGDHAEAHAGMMSEQDLEDLGAAEADERSRLFLEHMIIHHEGAITMAERHLEAGENPEALELSESIIDDQSAEIEEMEEMLRHR